MIGFVVSQIDAISESWAAYSAVLLFGLQVLYWCTDGKAQLLFPGILNRIPGEGQYKIQLFLSNFNAVFSF